MQKPRQGHYQAALRIIHYLKNDPAQGLLYKIDSELRLKAYNDADWATCPVTIRSITGYCVFLGNSLVSWKCIKKALCQDPHQKPSIERSPTLCAKYSGLHSC
jgi:hypothetical protein